jgi:hypothetical protein
LFEGQQDMPMRRSIFVFAGIVTLACVAVGQEGRFERTVNVSGPVDLDLVTEAGGIVVTTGAAGSVQIRGILKASHDKWIFGTDSERNIREIERNPPIQGAGNTVRVGHMDKSLLHGVSMRLEIVTPPDTRLRARADSGGIRVEGLKGPLDCQTDSGGIRANNIGGEVRAATDSGGIHIQNVQGPVHAKADSGGIDALDIAGAIDAQTDSGGIRLSQTRPDTIRARADSGGAHVKLASSAGYEVRAESESGQVSVSDIAVQGTISRKHVQGRVRGGGPVVDVRVSSGHVTID